MRHLACLMLAALALSAGGLRIWAEQSTNGDPVLIGLLLPPEETEATSLRRGVQLGVNHVNQSLGMRVSLLVRGRVGQWGADGEEAGRMVLDDGVRGLITAPGGDPSHLALQIAGRTATPVISLCPDSSVVGAGVPWMVRIVPGTRDEARLLFSSFRTNATGREFLWSALVPTERPGRETTSDLRNAAEAEGRVLRRPVEVAWPLKDCSKIVQQVLAAQPDGILLWLDATRAGNLAKSLRAAGFTGRLAGPSRLQSTSFTASAGRAAEGFLLPSPVSDAVSKSTAAHFTSAYRQQFGEEPDATSRVAYDAAVLLTDLLRESGDTPPRHAFPIKRERPGASGCLKFDANGNRIVPLHLLQFRNGRFTPLAGPDSPQ